MAVPTFRDYSWTYEGEAAWLFEAYCLTIVRDATIEGVLAALPTAVATAAGDYSTLEARAYDSVGPGAPHVIGLFEQDGSVVGFEPNGYLGVTTQAMEPVSAGREVVSHYQGGHGVGGFDWYVNGETRTRFEPLFAYGRDGSEPDALLPLMREVGGFCLDAEADPTDFHHFEATFALCEAITTIRVTEGLLRTSQYLVADIPLV